MMLGVDQSQAVGPPWTASRCNRTLRQLTAFLAKIEKWHRDFADKVCGQTRPSDGVSTSGSGLLFRGEEEKTNDPNWLCKQNRQSTRRAEKSYAGRRKARRGLGTVQSAKCLPYTPKARKAMEAIIDTPMMMSILTPAHTDSSELLRDVQVREPQLKLPPKHKVALLRRKRGKKPDKEGNVPVLPNWSCLTIDEMEHIVSSFLTATSEARLMCDSSGDDLHERKGPKSLFLSCLYTIPSLIIAEQSYHDMTTDGYDGEVQVASSLLMDLEDHYGDAHEGWGPLRIVTRAYGIALICNSIRRGFLPIEAAMSLASSLADRFGVNDATKAIAEAIFEVRDIASVDDLSDALTQCIGDAELDRAAGSPSTSTESNADALRFRLTDIAFKRTSKSVSLGLMSVRPTYLKDAIQSCSQRRLPDAVSLVKTLMLRFLDLTPRDGEAATARLRITSDQFRAGLESRTVEAGNSLVPEDVPANLAAITSAAATVTASAFRSGIVALVAFAISRKIRHKQGNTEQLHSCLTQSASVRILRDLCLAVHVDMELHGVAHLTQDQVQRRVWIVFAYSLLVTMLPVSNGSHLLTVCLEMLIPSSEPCRGLVTDLSLFVLELVTACSLTYQRGERVHSLRLLKEITNIPSCHKFGDSPVVALLFSHVAVEASMAHAQIATKDKPDALLWATELQHRLQASLSDEDVTLPTPSLSAFKRGFRWDEFISEWIVKTPSTTTKYATKRRPDLWDNLVSKKPLVKRSSLPTPPASTPDSPMYESMPRRIKKRKSAPEDTELHWDGDFAFRRPAKKRKWLSGELALPNPLTKPAVDVDSEDELGGN